MTMSGDDVLLVVKRGITYLPAVFIRIGIGDKLEILLQPPGQCFIATEHGKILGFACYDSSAKGFFGPIGVLEEERGRQIGTRLLLKTLDAMKAAGYWYAIIGWVDDAAPFYQKTVNARFIEDASPENSVYSNMVFMD